MKTGFSLRQQQWLNGNLSNGSIFGRDVSLPEIIRSITSTDVIKEENQKIKGEENYPDDEKFQTGYALPFILFPRNEKLFPLTVRVSLL